jgi:hypothetical protein
VRGGCGHGFGSLGLGGFRFREGGMRLHDSRDCAERKFRWW